MVMKKLFSLVLLLFSFVSYSQQEKHSRAKIYLDSNEKTLKHLSQLGLAVDHGENKKNTYFISDFSEHEITIAKENGYVVEIIIDDVSKFYADQNKVQSTKKKSPGIAGDEKSLNSRNSSCSPSSINSIVTPTNFQLGSMGGYFTYSEMLSILDNMTTQFPNLITAKQPIGTFTSTEGRPIYWLKISDNPNVNESEPQILYTALHHAREPASLSQMIFYMYYLLENYASNPEIHALVDNTELYFVPCVNPDGYVYNQTTYPNGGGLWRKNRKNNNDGTFGVDLNRNYGFMWGIDDTGSSPTTNNETYRGASAFSEPEIQAMKWFDENHQFKMSINYHAYGNDLIYPWGYIADLYTTDSALFVEHSKLMTSVNHFLAGTGNQTVQYVTNGDSDDWGYGEQTTKAKILSMTPEIGNSADGFWPPQNMIVPICQNTLQQNIYGAELIGKYAIATDLAPSNVSNLTGYLNYSIERLGLDSPAVYTITIIPLDSWITSVGSPKTYSTMGLLQKKQDSISYTLNSTITQGQTFSYILRVNNGLYDNNDTITKFFGQTTALYSNNGASLSDFTSAGGSWGISTSSYVSAPGSISDSPIGNYANNSNKTLTLNNPINLTSALSASINFWTKWNLETGYDYVEVLASDDGGSNWSPLCGKFTKPGNGNQDLENPLYDGSQPAWVFEEMSLNSYVGGTIMIRFQLISDQGVNADGFYFDDLSVNTVTATAATIDEKSANESLISQNIPNPASTITSLYFATINKNNLTLNIYNSLGELVKQEKISDKQTSLLINVSTFANGTYFYRVVNENFHSNMMKMVVLR